MRTYLIVWNQTSGLVANTEEVETGIQTLQSVGTVVGCTLAEVLDKQKFDHLIETNAITHVVAIGGDGTVSAVAGQLVGTELVLCVVPTGTFNHFAKHCGLPLLTSEALACHLEGDTAYIDVGEINGNYFVNFSCIGLYTLIVRDRDYHQVRGWTRWWKFVKVAYRRIKSLPRQVITVELAVAETEVTKLQTALVFIGNNAFDFGSLDVLASRKSLTDSVLQVSILTTQRPLKLLLVWLFSFFMDIRNRLGFTTVVLKKLTINGPKSVLVSLDGEVRRLKTPLVYQSHAKALKLSVPRGHQSGQY